MITLDLSILNQKGTPMFNSDTLANRPAAGIAGRIFIAIDAPYGIYRDTGTSWDQVSAGGGAVTNIYTADGTLTGNRTVSSGGFNLTFAPQTTFLSSLTAATGGSSYSVLGSNTLSYAVGFSSSNIGNVYSANGAINAQTFLGNATFAQANLASAMVNVNKIDFGSVGHTVTMTQSTAPGVRAMTGVQNQIQFTGSHNGTISHAAVSQNLGFFRDTGSTRTLTITNAYSHLINPLDDYGAGFTFTNRWGIYQAGASDTNYFAANVLIGSSTNLTQKLQVTGNAYIKGSGATSATYGLEVQNSAGALSFLVTNDRNTLVAGNLMFAPSYSPGSYGVITQVSQVINVQGVNNTPAFKVAAGVTADFFPINGNIVEFSANITAQAVTPINHFGITGIIGNANPTATSVNIFRISHTVTQGAGSTITRGIYINPTINAANDWRALEISTGISVLAPSTTASATLRVPTGTAPTTPTNGDIWFDGTNLFMRIGGTTKTFTII